MTGKPAGDDLREGKRTVLVAIARERLAAPQRDVLDELLGDPALDDEQVRVLQRSLQDCGAVDEVERIIATRTEEATRALESAAFDRDASIALAGLAEAVTRRAS